MEESGGRKVVGQSLSLNYVETVSFGLLSLAASRRSSDLRGSTLAATLSRISVGLAWLLCLAWLSVSRLVSLVWPGVSSQHAPNLLFVTFFIFFYFFCRFELLLHYLSQKELKLLL